VRRACFTEALQASHRVERADCLRIDDVTQREECVIQVAARTGVAEDCQAITDREIADACWYHGAGSQPNGCARIENSDLKHRCALDHWHHGRAPELCGLLGSPELERVCVARSRPSR
jgi:hypothetical protein